MDHYQDAIGEEIKNAINQQNAKLSQGGAIQGAATTASTPYAINERAYRVPLKEQLEKSAAEADDVRRRQQRAHDILTRHPEFEEFLELQDIINRGLWR